MFPLFELVKVVNFSDRRSLSKHCHNGKVVQHAWREYPQRNLFSLYFSNDTLLLLLGAYGLPPVIKQLPWYPGRPIVTLNYDPSGCWLLAVTSDCSLFIIPQLKLLNKTAKVEAKWRTDDITEIPFTRHKGVAVCGVWWASHSGEQVACLGTQQGHILLINLTVGHLVTEVTINEHITCLDLLQTPGQITTTLLITTKSNTQWKVLLEQQTQGASNMAATAEHVPQTNGNVSRSGNFLSVLHTAADAQTDSTAVKFQQFPSSVLLSTQAHRGSHCVAAHDLTTSNYQVYDSEVAHPPLYAYCLPTAREVLLTEHLLFLTSPKQTHTLSVISRPLSEATDQSNQAYNEDSTIQELALAPGEEILSIMKKTFPKMLHRHQEISLNRTEAHPGTRHTQQGACLGLGTRVWDVVVDTHTVLDGCLVLTDCALYQCRPRVSPERLFLDLLLTHQDTTLAERLGITLHLHIHSLYKLAAHTFLEDDNPDTAINLLKMSKCSSVERARLLLQFGHVSHALNILRPLTTSKNSISLEPAQRSLVARLALQSFAHQLLVSEEGSQQYFTLHEQFNTFLTTNFFFNKETALDVLVKFQFFDLLVEFALERSLTVDAVRNLVNATVTSGANGNKKPVLIDLLNTENYLTLARVENTHRDLDVLMSLLGGQELLQLLQDDPKFVMALMQHLMLSLPRLSADSLLQVVQLCDLSQPTLAPHIHKLLTHSHRDISGDGEVSPWQQGDDGVRAVAEVIKAFVQSVLQLNMTRPPLLKHITDFLSNTDQEQLKDCAEHAVEDSLSEVVRARPCVLASGSNFTAYIQQGELYMWGAMQDGRLGCGASSSECEHLPQLVNMLSARRALVLSVACGGHHSLAITEKGVFGWGSSMFGQVGSGETGTVHTRPVPVAGFGEHKVVQVACGHHHSAAVTHTGRLYTWGWGVHGQLGHGAPEDQCQPTPVDALSTCTVVQVAAGVGHTLVLVNKGDVYTFGASTCGQLGHGGTEKITFPKRVEALPQPVKLVSTAHFHNIVVCVDGSVYRWGMSPVLLKHLVLLVRRARAAGQNLSNFPRNDHLFPHTEDVGGVEGKIVQIHCGNTFTTLVTDKGRVYTHGINNDGQLGTGTRMMEKEFVVPKYLDDVNIAALATGPAYCVAVDTDGELYGWGNNEMGQLGLLRRKPVNSTQTVHIKGRAVSRMMTEFVGLVEPTHVQNRGSLGMLKRTRRLRTELQLAAHSQAWWLEECDGSEAAGGELRIPLLKGPDPQQPYPSSTVIQVIQVLGAYVSVGSVLVGCVQRSLWQVAAQVAGVSGTLSQALAYHLKALAQCRAQLTHHTQHITIATSLVTHYVGKVTKDGSVGLADATSVTALQQMCTEMLHYWAWQALSIPPLEELVTDNLRHLAVPFFTALVRCSHGNTIAIVTESRPDSDNPVTRTSPASDLMCNVQDLCRSFSAPFMMQLVEEANCQASSADHLQKALLQVLSTAFVESSLKVTSSKVKDKLIPKQKLWVNILANLKQEDCDPSPIMLTQKELNTLAASDAAVSPSNGPESTEPSVLMQLLQKQVEESPCDTPAHCDVCGNGDANQGQVMLFSCGHHSTRCALAEDLVPQLEVGLTLRDPPLLKTAAALSKAYLSPSASPLGLSCPKCVLDSLTHPQYQE